MMKMNRQRFILLGSMLALLISATANTPITKKEIPNFQQVNERFYRGGQPKPGSLKRLAEMGIKTVINLRDEDSEVALAEEKEAREAGLQYFSFPLKQLSRPKEEQMKRIMAVINSAEHQPVFV
ncbi:MAG TPA: sulfur transferase domain-containing protein, partial [Blastocatellia bacterium]|nr:sulfur transferase domain-containing protein [Blastocatellia bacterium]